VLSYAAWEQVRKPKKALDTLVGALAMRTSLPRFMSRVSDHRSRTTQIAEQEPQQADFDPFAYLTDVLTWIVNGKPIRDIDQLRPWSYRAQAPKPAAGERRLP
jgi:hypothetical protein